MTWEIELQSNSEHFRIQTHGAFRPDRFRKLVEETIHTDGFHTACLLHLDHRDLNFSTNGDTEMSAASNVHKQNNISMGSGKTAFLVTQQAQYGVVWMYENITSDSVDSPMRVCTGEDEAMAWLQS